METLQSLALCVAQARSPESVLREMVSGLGSDPGVALARVWLLERDERGQPSLRLKASVGYSVAQPGLRWDHTEGRHGRVPIDYGKIGRIASSSQPLLLQRGPHDWLMEPQWADAECIESFAGQPLCFKGEVLGVCAVFSRRRIEAHELSWLRVFADHAAVAIANARAFEEIEALKERLRRERDYLRQAVRDALHPADMIAESAAMKRLMRQVRAVAHRVERADSGRERSRQGADRIGDPRAERAGGWSPGQGQLRLGAARAVRERVLGHVRGAFSGASRNREGRFALAHGGTLFLDEVGEIPHELQGKLLRVLQERSFEPVGDDRTRHVDVRVIAATNRDLESEVEQGRFRLDLFYRLSVFPLEIPPLRERCEEIVPLARQFLRAAAHKLNTAPPSLNEDDERALLEYDFPGNIRELQNLIERAVVLQRSEGGPLSLQLSPPRGLGTARSTRAEAPASPSHESPGPVLPAERLRELERQNIVLALDRCAWRVAGEQGAAKLLGLKPSTLAYQIKVLGIERPRSAQSLPKS